jgi:DNA replication and repair protein RecF
MIESIKVRDLRCIEAAALRFVPGWNYLIGANAQGKTSLLEAVCVLVRLQSPRARRLGDLIRHGAKGFVVDGHVGGRHLQFYYGSSRRKLALDSVAQSNAAEYLEAGRIVFFANTDIELVRGGGEGRRKYLDFCGVQVEPGYRAAWKEYERALRSRNRLLKLGPSAWKQVDAFSEPLIRSGSELTAFRRKLVNELRAQIAAGYRRIAPAGSEGEAVTVEYAAGAGQDFRVALESSREEERRLRQTVVGPHRDDLLLLHNGHPAAGYCSEGQQRTLAIALRVGQAELLMRHSGRHPLYLLDDVFGELDAGRRGALMAALPVDAQKIVASTNLDWIPGRPDGPVWEVRAGAVDAAFGSHESGVSA